MISFQVVETFTAAPLNMVSGISDLELVVRDGKTLLYTATRAGGGVLALGITCWIAYQSLINVAVIIVGMFLDAASIMVILGPLFYKVGLEVGIDPIHLGVVLTVNGAIGMFTPPFGLNLFVASSLGGVTYEQAVRGSIPYIFLAIMALLIVTYIPQISMWLPRLLYPGI